MSDRTDVRWQQRFHNYERALDLLLQLEAKGPQTLDVFEEIAAAQCFVMTYELGWNLLRDYLRAQEIPLESPFPRQVVKEAFAFEIIDDGQVWIDIIEDRNKVSHTYEEAVRDAIVPKIFSVYLPAFKKLQARMKEEMLKHGNHGA